MNYSFQLSNIGRAERKASDLLLASRGRPRRCVSLIPAGDRYSSRGQRPRKTRPPQGPTLKGSNPGGVTPILRPAAQGNTTPSGSNGQTSRFPGALPPATILCPCRARNIYTSVLPRGTRFLTSPAAGEPRELEALCRLHLSVLRAERAGSGQHPRR